MRRLWITLTILIMLASGAAATPLTSTPASPTPPAPAPGSQGPPRPEPGVEIAIPRGTPPPAVPGPRPAQSPAVSRLGGWSRIVFTSYVDNNWEIHVADGDGANLARRTYDPAVDTAPRLNRGCTKIAFASTRDGNYEIYTMNWDGSEVTQLTNTTAPITNTMPTWSPDGTLIAFQSARDGNYEIYVMNADGSNPQRRTDDPAYDGEPVFSPDGTRIAFVSNRSGQYEVWVMDANGANQTQLTHGVRWGGYPAWSPDGTRIAFNNDFNDDDWLEIGYVDVSSGSINAPIYANYAQNHWNPTWSPLQPGSPSDGLIAFTKENWTYQGQWYLEWSAIYTARIGPGLWTDESPLLTSSYARRPHWETMNLFYQYLPVILKRSTGTWCDPYESNEDPHHPWGPLQSAQFYQAKLCARDAEDNYYFEVETTNLVQVRLQLPGSLVNHTAIWLYAQSDLSQPICGTGPVMAADYAMQCSIFQTGWYIIRLYADDAADDVNPYTLQVTFQ